MWLHSFCWPLLLQAGALAPSTPLRPLYQRTGHPSQLSTSLPGCVNDRKKQLRQLFRSLQGQKKNSQLIPSMENHWYHTGPLSAPVSQHSSTCRALSHPPSLFPALAAALLTQYPTLPWTSLHQKRANLWDWIDFNLGELASCRRGEMQQVIPERDHI